MKLCIQSQEAFVYSNLVALIAERSDRDNSRYSQVMEFGLAELIRAEMRSMAQEGGNWSEEILLRQATQQVEQHLQEQLPHAMQFEFAPYRTGVQQRLKFPAREMAELGIQRQRLAAQEQTSGRERFISATTVPFDVVAVKGEGTIKALIAIPAIQELVVEIDPNTTLYQVEDEWFPFQVTAEKFQFVIDDDGSIYSCTAYYPSDLLILVKQGLLQLADQIYRTK